MSVGRWTFSTNQAIVGRLAAPGDPFERLVPQAVLDALGQLGDGGRLVARRLEQ